jgi:hypothetical protein
LITFLDWQMEMDGIVPNKHEQYSLFTHYHYYFTIQRP